MDSILAIFNLGGGEIMLVLVVVLVLFGAKKIPDFAKGLGQGIKEFKKASREVQDEIERAGEEIHAPPPPTPSHSEPAATVAAAPEAEVQSPATSAPVTEGSPAAPAAPKG